MFQDDERKEFNEQLEDLTKQIDEYLKQKNTFEEQEKKFKTDLEKKDKEIVQLQTKIVFLNKKIKSLENKITTLNNTVEEQSKSISNVINNNIINQNINNSNIEEIIDYKKINCTLSQQNLKKINIRNMKNYYNRSSSSINNNNNNSGKNHINILYNKNLDNPKKINTKKLLLRNMSASNIDPNNINNYNKNNIFSNYNNKNSSVSESISNYIYKINESEYNNISRDNSNNKKNNNNNINNHSNINSVNPNKLKLKLPVNITNNNYNMNKNNVMINLSTNIVSNNLNLEKLKVQQKLVEYRKLIDKKINELINNKKRNPKNFDLYKKVSISCLKSDYNRKPKKKMNNVSNTSSKLLNNEYFKNIHDKNAILPKKINHPCGNKKLFKSNSQLNIKIKQSNKKKLNIISKDIDEKSKFNIHNFDEDEKDNNIHDQITSKGIDEEKSEDSKKQNFIYFLFLTFFITNKFNNANFRKMFNDYIII